MPIIKKHQNLVDFTAQHAGTVEGLFEVAQLNGLSITDTVAAGTLLSSPVIDPTVPGVFEEALDITSYNLNSFVRQGGIGYMQVGSDFKVS